MTFFWLVLILKILVLVGGDKRFSFIGLLKFKRLSQLRCLVTFHTFNSAILPAHCLQNGTGKIETNEVVIVAGVRSMKNIKNVKYHTIEKYKEPSGFESFNKLFIEDYALAWLNEKLVVNDFVSFRPLGKQEIPFWSSVRRHSCHTYEFQSKKEMRLVSLLSPLGHCNGLAQFHRLSIACLPTKNKNTTFLQGDEGAPLVCDSKVDGILISYYQTKDRTVGRFQLVQAREMTEVIDAVLNFALVLKLEKIKIFFISFFMFKN